MGPAAGADHPGGAGRAPAGGRAGRRVFGLAGVFSGWKIAFLGVLCAAAWIDWAQDPKGKQTEVGRMGFVSSTPNLLMAVLLTLAFLVVLCGSLPAEQ